MYFIAPFYPCHGYYSMHEYNFDYSRISCTIRVFRDLCSRDPWWNLFFNALHLPKLYSIGGAMKRGIKFRKIYLAKY